MSLTPAQISTTLHQYDDLVRAAIAAGTIEETMAQSGKAIVSELTVPELLYADKTN